MQTPEDISLFVQDAVRNLSMNTTRTLQQLEHVVGVSEMGACRNYLVHMVKGTEYDDPTDIKWPAFIGTALGERLELAMATLDGTRTQVPLTVTLPSGLAVGGTCDVLRPDAVWDFKAVNGLQMIRRSGPTLQQKAQIMLYLLAAIQAGLIPEEEAVAVLVFVDRSGVNPEPYVWMEKFDPSIIEQVDERLADVVYAVQTGEEAQRDQPYEWCKVACPFFTKCRGQELHASGLIEDEEVIQATKFYREGLKLEKEGKALKDEAKERLKGVEGSTGETMISWTDVPPTEVAAGTRAGYQRLNLRGIRKAKS